MNTDVLFYDKLQGWPFFPCVWGVVVHVHGFILEISHKVILYVHQPYLLGGMSACVSFKLAEINIALRLKFIV